MKIITAYFIFMLFIAIVFEVFAIFILVCGIHTAIKEKDIVLCIEMIICFLCLSVFSGFMSVGAYCEYQDTKPQNQVKILKQKVSDAEKELQKYLIDNPNLKTEEDYTK